jgi:hypothetical protein
MRLIAHRINTLEELATLDEKTPIEFDVRDSGGRLLVTHDPFTDGVDFEVFAPHLRNRFCIVNIKSEGIEWKVLEILRDCSVRDFFLLDCSVPMMFKLVQRGERRFAVRYSEYESINSVLRWSGLAQWVWVDCFHTYFLTEFIMNQLRQAGFNICIVSPELQGRPEDIPNYIDHLQRNNVSVQAVCTKAYNFPAWVALERL